MVFRYLEKIHKKPEAQRRQLALWLAMLLTAIIFFIWIFTVPARWRVRQVSEKDQNKIESPFAVLKESVSNTLNNFEIPNLADFKGENQGSVMIEPEGSMATTDVSTAGR